MNRRFNIYINNKILVYTTDKIDLLTRSIMQLCEEMGAEVSVIETRKEPEGIRAAEVYNTKLDHLDEKGEPKNKITILFK